MKCVVGLGNPGSKYELTRHNLGYMVVDAYARELGLSWRKSKKPALVASGPGVILVKPLTYMNNSGLAVGPIMQEHKLAPQDVLIIYDDVDLPLGTLRIRRKGSPGTHNGMRSITELLGMELMRLRLGMGPPPPHLELAHFVLTSFRPEEIPLVRTMVSQAVEAVDVWVQDGVEKAMCE